MLVTIDAERKTKLVHREITNVHWHLVYSADDENGRTHSFICCYLLRKVHEELVANRGLPSGKVDWRREDSNPLLSHWNATLLTAWPLSMTYCLSVNRKIILSFHSHSSQDILQTPKIYSFPNTVIVFKLEDMVEIEFSRWSDLSSTAFL